MIKFGSRRGTSGRSGSIQVKLRTRLDQVSDSLAIGALRTRLLRVHRLLGFTKVGYIAIGGAVVLWLFGYAIAGTATYLAAYGALAFVVIALLLAPRRLGLTGEREGLYPRAQEGDRLEVEVKLTARRSVSTFVLEERLPAQLGQPVRLPIVKLPAKSEVSHHYSVRAARRGVYQVGPLVAVAGDPMGLSRRETVVAEPFELLVHPSVEQVADRPLTRQYEDPPIRPPVSKPWPSGLEFYGMREYVPGDDLRRVVWRATARTGKVMVREAEQGITDHITIILDTDRGAHSHDEEGLSESFEAGVRAAASLGVKHLREGYEVRVETNGGPLTRPLRGAATQLMLLDAMARIGLSRDPVSAVIMRLIANPRRDAHNILITPKLGEREAAQLRLLLNTGVSVMVVALLWTDEHADTLTTAAALGCQVAAVHPGQDLSTALSAEIGAGTR
ncbi:MAG TPA: DUF58 domain-containing protein [Candidatus Dormibacteraeota bacterium]